MELLHAINRRGNTVSLVTREQRYANLCGRKMEISDGRVEGFEFLPQKKSMNRTDAFHTQNRKRCL